MTATPRPLRLVTTETLETRRAARCAALLARIRANTPERRFEVRHGRDILWRQFPAHLAVVLAAKAKKELARV